MRILVLGGTVFLGHATAAEAVRRGHEVVCAARGSNPVPDGATLVKVDRDAEDGLAPVAGRWDAVIDVATISYPWVRRAVEQVETAHWTFVSSVSVYGDFTTVNDTLLPPLEEGRTRLERGAPDDYGSIKVASENAVRDVHGDDAFIVRAGLITGPGDWSDRFGYWPARFARGGRAVVPAVDRPTQFVDVRDLASWLVDGAERRIGGTFDAVGPALPLIDVLTDIAGAVDLDTEIVPVAERALEEQGVTPWSGPKSLPLWLPTSHYGMTARDAGPAMDAGLTIRPLADAVAGALEQERALGLDRADRRAGLTPEEEATILAAL